MLVRGAGRDDRRAPDARDLLQLLRDRLRVREQQRRLWHAPLQAPVLASAATAAAVPVRGGAVAVGGAGAFARAALVAVALADAFLVLLDVWSGQGVRRGRVGGGKERDSTRVGIAVRARVQPVLVLPLGVPAIVIVSGQRHAPMLGHGD